MRILVVDDDIEICEFLKVCFESESFSVEVVHNGDEGSYMARTRPYDCIILDNILPKKNGGEICEEIRKSGKNTPIVMLSVCSEPGDKVKLLNAGADDYISKPFSYQELQSRIRALLRRPPVILKPVLKIDDLILDTEQQQVRHGSRNIYLTRKEFALTEYLMKNSGGIVTRSMLMEHVWDDSINPFSNTIEAHIMNLRKKIDRSAKKKLIHTVPGRGYKISEKGRAIFS